MPKLPSEAQLRSRGFRLFKESVSENIKGFKKYKKIEPVWARQMKKPFKVDTKEGDDIKGKAGDYLCIGVSGEMWPIDKDIFHKTYREIPESE